MLKAGCSDCNQKYLVVHMKNILSKLRDVEINITSKKADQSNMTRFNQNKPTTVIDDLNDKSSFPKMISHPSHLLYQKISPQHYVKNSLVSLNGCWRLAPHKGLCSSLNTISHAVTLCSYQVQHDPHEYSIPIHLILTLKGINKCYLW